MKETICLFLLICILIPLVSCGNSPLGENEPLSETVSEAVSATAEEGADSRHVPNPTVGTDYSFDHTPTVEEMRATAVQAMRDLLTVQWFPEKTVRYNKNGAVSHKNFEFLAERYYMGLPYTSAGTGLFQFLEYYDSATGALIYTDQASFNETIGTSCAGATSWALFTVCHSLGGNGISNFLTISNGYYPLGGVTYDPAVTDFNDLFTTKILEDNGKERVFQGYAAVQAADLLVFSQGGDDGGHTRMAIAPANVVWENGAINGEKSTITIQDQAAESIEDSSSGVSMTRSGNLEKTFPFDKLYKDGYMAVTTAEFLGQEDYQPCEVRYEGKAETLEDLNEGAILCNYPMAVIRVSAVTDGGESVSRLFLLNRRDVGSGRARSFSTEAIAANLGSNRTLTRANSYTVTVEVTSSTGEHFTPLTLTVG